MSFKQIFSSFQSLWNALFGPKYTVAMIGDSIIANLATTNTQSLLHAPYNTALNLGVHGNTSAQIAARLGSIPKSVRTLLLEGGGNDVLIAPNDVSVINNAVNAYAFMLNQIPRSTRVLLLGIARIDESIAGPQPNAQFAAINARIAVLAAQLPNVTVLTEAQNVNMVGQTIDGVHPSTAGYALLFSKIPA